MNIYENVAQITCRPLKGDTFEVEVGEEAGRSCELVDVLKASVADLKKAITEKHAEPLGRVSSGM